MALATYGHSSVNAEPDTVKGNICSWVGIGASINGASACQVGGEERANVFRVGSNSRAEIDSASDINPVQREIK